MSIFMNISYKRLRGLLAAGRINKGSVMLIIPYEKGFVVRNFDGLVLAQKQDKIRTFIPIFSKKTFEGFHL